MLSSLKYKNNLFSFFVRVVIQKSICIEYFLLGQSVPIRIQIWEIRNELGENYDRKSSKINKNNISYLNAT